MSEEEIQKIQSENQEASQTRVHQGLHLSDDRDDGGALTKKELLDVIVEVNTQVTYQVNTTKGTYERWRGRVEGVRMIWQRILAALPTEPCTLCDGGRVAPGVHPHTGQPIEASCSTCHGSGRRLAQHDRFES